MAVLTRDDYFNRLHERIGDDTSDEAISFLEDLTDTYNDLETKSKGNGEDWEKKYHDLDESWKKRYRHRFFTGGGTSVPDMSTNGVVEDEYNAETITVNDLFTEKKGE